jgi:hypothetical protein
MRLWSIHPKYLDSKGIVALWREGLLAQKVLKGAAKGFNNNPQLDRFKRQKNPLSAIATYLFYVWEEANKRGYNFNKRKIETRITNIRIEVTEGQIMYEFEHLKNKLKERDSVKYESIAKIKKPEAHPIFLVKNGAIEIWEKVPKG